MSAAPTPIEILSLDAPRYPDRLRRMTDPPPVLYVRGELRAEEPAVAIVGARRATPTGRIVAERLAGDLARSGVAVVSGLARGIDAAAHRGALQAGGRTIAVFGCGPDVTYPPEHHALAEAIVRQGAVVTEFPPGVPPFPHHFPRRNRIISGLSLAVVVVEGNERSGALSTALHALRDGREVMAVPGNVLSEMSRAPHGLLRDGATLVERAEDVLWALHLPVLPDEPPAEVEVPQTEAARAVWQAVGVEATHIDGIAAATGLSPAAVGAILTELELLGLVRQFAGKQFIRPAARTRPDRARANE